MQVTGVGVDQSTRLRSGRRIQGIRRALRLFSSMLRVHQWSKNLLVVAPLIISHQVDPQHILAAVLAFAAFSLTASAAYIINDIIDLPADRKHETKKFRPFASGSVPLYVGFLTAPILLLSAAIAAAQLPSDFGMILAIYFAATCAYSFRLKRMLLIDVVTLGCLYALRVIAGGAALDAVISEWLTAFSVVFFMCIALVKRYTELAILARSNKKASPHRSYSVEDLPILLSIAAGAGFGSIIILMLYISSDEVLQFYKSPERLWLMTPIFIYWISRLLLLAHRLKVAEDPVIFALRDVNSLVCGLLVGGLLIWSI